MATAQVALTGPRQGITRRIELTTPSKASYVIEIDASIYDVTKIDASIYDVIKVDAHRTMTSSESMTKRGTVACEGSHRPTVRDYSR